MKTLNLLQDITFNDTRPNAEPLHVDDHGRILRFALQPGQAIKEHKSPNSPVTIIVLQGHGLFSGGDGILHQYGPNDLLYCDPGEPHSIQAGDEPLVFLVMLQK